MNFQRERLIYFLIITLLALTSIYIFFTGDFEGKQKKNLEASVSRYMDFLNSIDKINVIQDSAIMAKTKEIQQRQLLLESQLAQGLITESEANRKMESLNKELDKVQEMMLLKLKDVNIENERLIYSNYRKDSVISVLLNKPIVDNTDYDQIESIRKKAKIAEEEKGRVLSNFEILSNEFNTTKSKLIITTRDADSLNNEIRKNPRARVTINNIRLETQTGRAVQPRYPNGSNESSLGEIIVIFDIAAQSSVPFGPRTITVRYMRPDGIIATSTDVAIDFKGEKIRGLRASIKYPKFPQGVNMFLIIDDNMKVGSTNVIFGN